MFRKTLSVILAVAMLCTMIPFVALAEETATATATVIAVDDKSATIEVAGVLTEGNTYSNPVVKNGAATLASSITGDEIKVTGLTALATFSASLVGMYSGIDFSFFQKIFPNPIDNQVNVC